ncbi:MAG: hypothetical protein Q9209_005000 [Squamulea sp. 1 TL-2023]
MTSKDREGRHYPLARFEYLDELATPLAVETDNHTEERPTLRNSYQPHLQAVSRNTLQEEAYCASEKYQKLDEVKAPSLEDHRSSTAHSDRVRNSTHDEPVLQQEAAPSPTSTDFNSEKKTSSARHQQISRFAIEFYTISYLIFFSILGTLARLGLQALTFYPGAPVTTSVLWANVAGSFTMGFLSEDRNLFRIEDWTHSPSAPLRVAQYQMDQEQAISHEDRTRNHASLKRTIPFYIGLSTGFCGSLTSFSSFMRDAFLALANVLPVPISYTSSSTAVSPGYKIVHRNGGYSFEALLAVIITTVALCISALIVGAQLAVALERYTPSLTYLFARRFVDRAMVVLAWGSWLGAMFMAVWPPDRVDGPAYNAPKGEYWRGTAIFAIVFAPLGCLSRFYISLVLNPKIKSFPLGTFVVNMLGTALEGMFWDLQHSSRSVGGGVVGCQVLQGMMDGFCGAATTVSTWVAELNGLRRRHAWVYGGVSVLVGVGIMVGILGGALWGRGWDKLICMG